MADLFTCECGASLEIAADMVGTFDCPSCGQSIEIEDDEPQPARAKKGLRVPAKKRAPAAKATPAKRQSGKSRAQFLTEMRAGTAYSSLRGLITIYFWVAMVINALLCTLAVLAAMGMAKGAGSTAGLPIAAGAFGAWLAVTITIHAIYQFYTAYIDIADASIEQAYQAQR